jgi:hypothetical protein
MMQILVSILKGNSLEEINPENIKDWEASLAIVIKFISLMAGV